MRVLTFAKLSALSALSVGTWLVTSAIIARVRPLRAAASQLPPARTNDKIGKIGDVRDPRLQQPGRTTIASYAMQSLRVGMKEGGIHLQTSAQLRESRPGMRYVWSVSVKNESKSEIVFLRNYHSQVFSPPLAQIVSPTFEELLPLQLPRGDYTVTVSIFTLPRGPELKVLDDPRTAQAFSGPKAWRKFTIP